MQEKESDRMMILNYQTELCEKASSIKHCPEGETCMKYHLEN